MCLIQTLGSPSGRVFLDVLSMLLLYTYSFLFLANLGSVCLGFVLTLARRGWEGTVINSKHIIVLLFSGFSSSLIITEPS